MSGFRQLLLGILAALLSSILLLGGLTASLVESGSKIAPASTTQTYVEKTLLPTAAPILRTALPGEPTSTLTFTPLPSLTPTYPPPTGCPPPPGWIAITVQVDDTLASLAQAYGVAPQQIQTSNCLLTASLPAGSILYVPPPPSPSPTLPPPTDTLRPTSTSVPCGPPPNWVFYTVHQGDTLYRLSLLLGVSIDQLKAANCLGSSDFIRGGQVLYVPFIPIPTPTPTFTPAPTATLQPAPSPSATHAPPPPTPTRPAVTPTIPPTVAPTETLVPTSLPATSPATSAPLDTTAPTQVTPASTSLAPTQINTSTPPAQFLQPGW